jgi:hypothetical protein
VKEHCHNNRPPPLDGYWVHVRHYHADGTYTFKMQEIPNVMSRECGQPGKGLPPAEGCVGCRFLNRNEV